MLKTIVLLEIEKNNCIYMNLFVWNLYEFVCNSVKNLFI